MHIAHLAQQARRLADELASIARAEETPARRAVAPHDLVSAAQRYIRLRRRRDGHFPEHLFADPAWDILLELFVSEETGRPLSITAACIAGAVPQTTGLRWIVLLEEKALVVRRAFADDRRVRYLELTPHARGLVIEWLEHFVAVMGISASLAATAAASARLPSDPQRPETAEAESVGGG